LHIPDNYLSPGTCAVFAAAMVPAWMVSARKVKAELPGGRLPLLGIGAAFAFLIMMFNVPVPGGTTVHAVGGTLVAVLLGPWAACMAISVALFLQAVLFGDGGILAYGANCFNMALVIPLVGYAAYRFLGSRARSERGRLIALGLAAYLALVAGALCAGVEFGLQPALAKDPAGLPLFCPYPLAVAVPAMVLPHLLVAGWVEALFTVAVFSFVRRLAPDLPCRTAAPPPARLRPMHGLLAVLIALSPLGLLAHGSAWGEWSAGELRAMTHPGGGLRFLPAALLRGPRLGAVLSGYQVPGLPPWLGYLLSAAAGCAVLVIASKLLRSLKGGLADPDRS
jgi:cobalt/nickel transport system permease protein